jgi:quercetin dioxygenase-like cupin family protein
VANPGQVIDLSSLGVRITFLVTSEQTNGEFLRVDVVLPAGFSIAEHVHPEQEEQHQVLSGVLRGRVGGQEQDYHAGQRVIGPAGVPHAWCNPSDREVLHLVSEHRPVRHMELMLEAGSHIARDFAANRAGALKHVLRAAVLLDTIKDDFYFTGWSMRALMTLFAALAPIGRLATGPPWIGRSANGAATSIKEP